jgi:hypothetical protein
MNYGLSLARGDYVFFCAADDHIEPGLFEFAISKLEQYPQAAIFAAEMRLLHPSGGDVGVRPIARPSQHDKFFGPKAVRKLLRGNDQFIATTTAVFRRALLVASGGFQESLGAMADTVCARELALRHGFFFSPVILADHSINPRGLSRSTAQSSDAVRELIMRGRSLIESNPLYPKNYAWLFERRMRFAVCRIALAEAAEPVWLVLEIGAIADIDRKFLQVCLKSSALWRRLLALTWLAVRLRPYSLAQLVRTAWRRSIEKLSK